MHAALFELSTSPRKLGVTDSKIFTETDDNLVDYISDYSEEYNSKVLKRLEDYFEYPKECLKAETETVEGKSYTKVKFTAVDKFFEKDIEALKEKVNNLTAKDLLDSNFVPTFNLDSYYGAALVYDAADGFTRSFYDWIIAAKKEEGAYDTKWYYLGRIYDYHC